MIHDKEAQLRRLAKEANKEVQESEITQLKKESERLQELVS